MDNELRRLINEKERTAEAYIKVASRYDIPLEVFGEKIPILNAEATATQHNEEKIFSPTLSFATLKETELEEVIHMQLLDYLFKKRNEKEERLGWEYLYNRIPDYRLRLAINLELLSDILIKKDVEPEKSWALLEDIWMSQARIKNLPEIYKNWGEKLAQRIVKEPYSNYVDRLISDFSSTLYTKKETFWQACETLIDKIMLWHKDNVETLDNRLKKLQEHIPDFNINSQKWQRQLLEDAKNEGIYLKHPMETINKGGTSAQLGSPNSVKERTEKAVPQLCIIGTHHGIKRNLEALNTLMITYKKLGFKRLTIEEPEDTSWKPYIEFVQTLERGKKWEWEELQNKALTFCSQVKNKEATAEKLCLIYLGKSLGFDIKFIDKPYQEKLRSFVKRKEAYLQKVVNSGPLDPNKPLTALGGAKTWAENIILTYKACKDRSLYMSQALASRTSQEKTLHIGGILHVEDIQEALTKLGRTVESIIIEHKDIESPITRALDKDMKSTKNKNVLHINLDRPFKKLIKSWGQRHEITNLPQPMVEA